MSNQRVLGFCWLGLSMIVWLVFRDGFAWAFGLAGIANPKYAGGLELSAILAVVATVVVAVVTWKRKEIHDFCYEAVDETRKVVWPNRKETRDNTIVVVITSVLMSLVLGFFDLIWAKLTNLILQGGA